MTDAQTVLAREMTEKQLSQHIVNLARMLGWRVHRDPTFRSTATDPGYPDLTLVRNGQVIWAELKAMGGRLSDAQAAWIDALPHDSERTWVFVWTPAHWLSGRIETALRWEPRCSGCAEPDAFDGADGRTHQMGTQEHPA